MIKKKAFTMLELVMVIVILGIVSSIGADIITKLYENYIKTRAINRLQAQTDLILDQIAKRLEFRIKDSVIARNDQVFLDFVALTDANESYDVLEWIGRDNESFLGSWDGVSNTPGWSGFIDLDSNETDRNVTGINDNWLKSIGSRFDLASATINALSNNQVDMIQGSALQKPVILFKGKSSYNLAGGYGWRADGNHTFEHRVFFPAGKTDVLEFIDTPPTEIYEQYNLAWSAYALRAVPVNAANNDYNLTLSYNYQPWYNERYDQNTTSTQVLAQNVSTFRFRQIGETIRIKLCIHDNNQTAMDFDFSFCKERVIY